MSTPSTITLTLPDTPAMRTVIAYLLESVVQQEANEHIATDEEDLPEATPLSRAWFAFGEALARAEG